MGAEQPVTEYVVHTSSSLCPHRNQKKQSPRRSGKIERIYWTVFKTLAKNTRILYGKTMSYLEYHNSA
jgi:hypothetical protein